MATFWRVLHPAGFHQPPEWIPGFNRSVSLKDGASLNISMSTTPARKENTSY